MDNETRLREQLMQVQLAPVAILHERGCTAPCGCDVRAIVSLKVRANNRAGYRTVRHIVRADKAAPEPKPFTIPEIEPEVPAPKPTREKAIVVLPVGDSLPEPRRKRRRKK